MFVFKNLRCKLANYFVGTFAINQHDKNMKIKVEFVLIKFKKMLLKIYKDFTL